jgi:hypothetical protein
MAATTGLGLPPDPDFRTAFTAYLEWDTRIASLVLPGSIGRTTRTQSPAT